MDLPRKFRAALLAAVIILPFGSVCGQEVSSAAAFIAMQCSASSGYPVEGYYGYGERLALTFEQLSPEQQARVLGYELTPEHNAVNKAGNQNSSGGNGQNNTALPPEEEDTLLDRLLNWIGL